MWRVVNRVTEAVPVSCHMCAMCVTNTFVAIFQNQHNEPDTPGTNISYDINFNVQTAQQK